MCVPLGEPVFICRYSKRLRDHRIGECELWVSDWGLVGYGVPLWSKPAIKPSIGFLQGPVPRRLLLQTRSESGVSWDNGVLVVGSMEMSSKPEKTQEPIWKKPPPAPASKRSLCSSSKSGTGKWFAACPGETQGKTKKMKCMHQQKKLMLKKLCTQSPILVSFEDNKTRMWL